MKLIINQDLLKEIPSFKVISYLISFNDLYNPCTKSNEVDNLLKETYNELNNLYDYSIVTSIPKLKETRDGYKALGKDPSHTRCAAEALLRRVLKHDELYRLGDVIDLGNVLSLKTLRSVCVVDYNKLSGDVIIRKGLNNESYNGINRGEINLSNMPVYTDDLGPFGCPTSDTLRTVVDNNTKKILIMIICFSDSDLLKDEELLKDLYLKYCNVSTIEKVEWIGE